MTSTAPATVEASPAAAQPETTTTTTASTGKEGDVIRSGEITLPDNNNANLVEGVVTNGVGVAGDLYLLVASPDLGDLHASAMVITDKAGTRAGCVDALTARRLDRVPITELKPGTWICITTQEGNVAAVRIIRPVGIGHPQIVFAYTVWR